MNLLSVDWDYFFPEGHISADNSNWDLWDWGHLETMMFIETLWPMRAAAFLHRGLPLPTTTGEENSFWNRFQFAPNCWMFFAESHSCVGLVEVEEGIKRVVNFDAHHDCGYKPLGEELKTLTKGRIAADNWGLFYKLTNRKVEVIYPKWKTWAFESETPPASPVPRKFDNGRHLPVFDRIFVCRSGAWVPPWCDGSYRQFLAACPVAAKTHLGPLVCRVCRQADIDQQLKFTEAARTLSEQTRAVITQRRKEVTPMAGAV